MKHLEKLLNIVQNHPIQFNSYKNIKQLFHQLISCLKKTLMKIFWKATVVHLHSGTSFWSLDLIKKKIGKFVTNNPKMHDLFIHYTEPSTRPNAIKRSIIVGKKKCTCFQFVYCRIGREIPVLGIICNIRELVRTENWLMKLFGF